eukprot:NODE_16063_length_1014_cov_3.223224.p1 GENE.NODE_16063_length_1014_cov_3.223224~~NODE_16063_length_1014_cov_3.223224.p1  ORF type:complete len:224 (-),score=56.91 NODE_16063_length_1014_cov_3.223224:343-933(-)
MIREYIAPIRYSKLYKPKPNRSPVLYGWQHNTPWSKHNNFAYFWSEKRPIRKTVVNHAQRVRRLSSFGTHFNDRADVMQELSQPGPFTLFVPTNEAMSVIRDSAWDKLWDEERALFLRHHAVIGGFRLVDLLGDGEEPPEKLLSLAGQPLPLTVTGSLETMDRVVRIAGAAVTKANIRCWNGFVHIIDQPIVPSWR